MKPLAPARRGGPLPSARSRGGRAVRRGHRHRPRHLPGMLCSGC